MFYMIMFRTKGFIYRKTVVTSTGTVSYISTCTVQIGTSEYGYAKITIEGFKQYVNIKYLKFNLLNAELNPICYLLALLGAHHFLHASRIRVKSLTLRLLKSYIYIHIYIYMYIYINIYI